MPRRANDLQRRGTPDLVQSEGDWGTVTTGVRAMRRVFSLIAVCLALLIVPNGIHSQPPRDGGGGKGGKGGKGGGKGARGQRGQNKGLEVFGGVLDRVGLNPMGGDPSLFFDFISNGQD